MSLQTHEYDRSKRSLLSMNDIETMTNALAEYNRYRTDLVSFMNETKEQEKDFETFRKLISHDAQMKYNGKRQNKIKASFKYMSITKQIQSIKPCYNTPIVKWLKTVKNQNQLKLIIGATNTNIETIDKNRFEKFYDVGLDISVDRIDCTNVVLPILLIDFNSANDLKYLYDNLSDTFTSIDIDVSVTKFINEDTASSFFKTLYHMLRSNGILRFEYSADIHYIINDLTMLVKTFDSILDRSSNKFLVEFFTKTNEYRIELYKYPKTILKPEKYIILPRIDKLVNMKNMKNLTLTDDESEYFNERGPHSLPTQEEVTQIYRALVNLPGDHEYAFSNTNYLKTEIGFQNVSYDDKHGFYVASKIDTK